MTDDGIVAEIELEPIDPTTLRAAEGSSVWETVRGKRNRIAIGRPEWLSLADGAPAALVADVQRRFSASLFDASILQLSLTLVPDRGCRFSTADLILQLASPDSVFVHLEPSRQTTNVTESKQGTHGSLRIGLPAVGEIALNTPRRDTEVSRAETSIEAFGVNTTEAGWRLDLTGAQGISLDTAGLRATLVTRSDDNRQISINAVAEIDVLTVGDRWLTWAFKRHGPTATLTIPGPS